MLDSPSVARVRAALAQAGVAADIVELPGAARTAKQAADFLGCSVAEIANSLVFRGATSGEPILVMSSGAKRVSLERLASAVGEPVEKADADFVRERTGFAIGGVAPVGHVSPALLLIDGDLLALDPIWAAAGSPSHVFRTSPAALRRLTGAAVADVRAL